MRKRVLNSLTYQARIGIESRMKQIEKQVAQEEGLDISEPGDQAQLMRALKKVSEYQKLRSELEKFEK